MTEPNCLRRVAVRLGLEVSCGKIAHKTKDRATEAMYALIARDPSLDGVLREYHCPGCNRWHVGKSRHGKRKLAHRLAMAGVAM